MDGQGQNHSMTLRYKVTNSTNLFILIMIIIEILCYICGKETEIICCPYLNICRHEKAKVFNLLRIGIALII